MGRCRPRRLTRTTAPLPSSAPPFGDLLALLSELADVCRSDGRLDLAERLIARRDCVAAPFVCVVVAGDYKAGKSTLVNALVGAELCPVDDDVATVVPTFVRYAEDTTVVVRSDGPDGEPVTTSVPIEQLPDFVSEKGNPANARRVRTVEVTIPSPLLREGIVLVDTPGVGGLGSEYTAATLASLSMAHAVLFVSDATQEYTAPELEFLSVARERCPTVLPVLTKIDMFPDWEVVRGNDEGWLSRTRPARAPELVAISADLALRGRRHARLDLQGESGLATLVERLRGLGDQGRTVMAALAATEVHTVTGQLAAPLRAEQDALVDPESVLAGLAVAEDDGRQLASGMAEWLLILDDGITDLDEEVEQEVADRLRRVQQEAERTLSTTDPGSSWDEFEAALTRQTSAEIGAASQLVVAGATRLAQRIAEHFVEHEVGIAPALSAFPAELEPTSPLDLERVGRTRWRGEVFEAGWGGVEAMGVIAGMLSVGVLNPFSLMIGVLIGGKSLREARQRELEQRRERASEAVERYLDDAKREADRGRQFALRRIRRELRSNYQRRADALYRSAS